MVPTHLALVPFAEHAWSLGRIPAGIVLFAVAVYLTSRWVPWRDSSSFTVPFKVSVVVGCAIGALLLWSLLLPERALDMAVSLTAIGLALSGIVYAVKHKRELEKHTSVLTSHEAKLAQIAGALTTASIGRFPTYVRHIADQTERAKSIRILADCADFGSFFDAEQHGRFFNELIAWRKDRGTVNILVAGPPAAFTVNSQMKIDDFQKNFITIMKNWWPDYIRLIRRDYEFVDWMKGAAQLSGDGYSEFSTWYGKYVCRGGVPSHFQDSIKTSFGICTGCDLTANDSNAFDILLQARQFLFARRLWRAGVDIRYDEQNPPSIFLWIFETDYADSSPRPLKNAALFAFSEPSSRRREDMLGFKTGDSELIEAFKYTFDRQFAKLAPWDPRA